MAGSGETQGEHIEVCKNNEHTDLKTLMEIISKDEVITTEEDLSFLQTGIKIEQSTDEECQKFVAKNFGKDFLETGMADAIFNTYMNDNRFDLAERAANLAKIAAAKMGNKEEAGKWDQNLTHSINSSISGSDTRND